MIDLPIAFGGLIVGFLVGMTGVGGGALMTPMLVLIFGVEPLTAVSSDLVAAVIMKPIGGGVHLRRGTVKLDLVKWLMVGSLPCAFLGVVLLKMAGTGPELQLHIKKGLGYALLVASTCILVRPLLTRRHRGGDAQVPVRIIPTILVGALGGLIVGMTSVGSGSLMIVLLFLLYPRFRLSDLVGTDLVQAIPLVFSAALGHVLMGDFKMALTGSILIGAVPGVYAGARLSSRAPDGILRPVLVVALASSSLKLLGAPNVVLAAAIAFIAVVAFAMSLPDIRRNLARAKVARSLARSVGRESAQDAPTAVLPLTASQDAENARRLRAVK